LTEHKLTYKISNYEARP